MRSHRSTKRSFTALGVLGALAPLHGAQAQSGACDQLKASLAARIDASIGAFSLEVVPAAAPLPAGAKVIGTCEGGARKVLLRRGAAAAAADAGGAPVADAASAADGPAKSRRALAAAERASQAAAVASAAAKTSKAAAAAASVPTITPAVVPVAEIRSSNAAPGPEQPAVVTMSMVPASSSERSDAGSTGNPSADRPSAAPTPLTQRVAALAAQYWPWLAGFAALLLAGPLWAWLAHRRAYDAAGLPRGPRLN